LRDKVTIVTGSGAGIGKAIMTVFAREGARVVGASRRIETGQPVVDAIVDQGGEAIFIQCDVSVEQDVEHVVAETMRRYKRIDVLVNNAGVNFVKPFELTSTEDWDRVINTDLRGTFFCCRHVIREMLKTGGGSIINISSVHEHSCTAGDVPYAAAKAGMVGLTKALAVEFADRNIRVNAVSPGAIHTQITDDVLANVSDPEAHNTWLFAQIPMGRRGRPEEVADLCAFLASDQAGYLTGTNIYLDGGLTTALMSRSPVRLGSIEGKERNKGSGT